MIVALLLLAWFAGSRLNDDDARGPANVVPAADDVAAGYVSQYGGDQGTYEGIVADTVCASLQASFDQAAANNDAATPGTAAHRASLGFMTASLDRMNAIGC